MKAAKRHELEKNELADWIGNHVEGAAEYFWPVVGGVVIAFAAAVGIAWYINAQDSAAAAAWDQYYQAFAETDRESFLKKVADDYPRSEAALWARQSLADINLAKGAALMFSDRPEATNRLREAETNYKEVLEKTRDPFLLARARYGMGRLQETQCQPEEAIKYYEKVVASEKDSPLGQAAARDIERLKKPEMVAFLDWFAKQEPKKPVPTSHGGMPPFQVPSDLPERPDISVPGGLNIDSVAPPPADATPSPGLEFPKPADAPKGDETPKAEEASKGNDAPKGEEAPQEDALKADAPKADSAPADPAPPAPAPKSGE
jgi:predicted negative regulator of RcsB-dependent stress response